VNGWRQKVLAKAIDECIESGLGCNRIKDKKGGAGLEMCEEYLRLPVQEHSEARKEEERARRLAQLRDIGAGV
jgi:hypothetical protein